ncbi:MAG: hypothetical protein HYT03_01400 [Candidatus Harrisonbacteria bacterium]|nr:hypothetical protein [Candidatus Harrisonbacteria bacterium]
MNQKAMPAGRQGFSAIGVILGIVALSFAISGTLYLYKYNKEASIPSSPVEWNFSVEQQVNFPEVSETTGLRNVLYHLGTLKTPEYNGGEILAIVWEEGYKGQGRWGIVRFIKLPNKIVFLKSQSFGLEESIKSIFEGYSYEDDYNFVIPGLETVKEIETGNFILKPMFNNLGKPAFAENLSDYQTIVYDRENIKILKDSQENFVRLLPDRSLDYYDLFTQNGDFIFTDGSQGKLDDYFCVYFERGFERGRVMPACVVQSQDVNAEDFIQIGLWRVASKQPIPIYLSNRNEDLTSLYDEYLTSFNQMIEREVSIYDLSDSDDIAAWEQGNAIRRTGGDFDGFEKDYFAEKRERLLKKRPPLSFQDFRKTKPFIYLDHPFGGGKIKLQLRDLTYYTAAEPIIYIYPEVKTEVAIEIEDSIKLIASDPPYKFAWHITAFPGSKLIDRSSGKKYDRLFWEGVTNLMFLPDRGWMIPKNEIEEFLLSTLPKYGLNAQETDDFIEAWLPFFHDSNYYLIGFFDTEETNRIAPLDIRPYPDTLIRVTMYSKPLNDPISIKSPILPKFVPKRNGFTIVEWGGLRR